MDSIHYSMASMASMDSMDFHMELCVNYGKRVNSTLNLIWTYADS